MDRPKEGNKMSTMITVSIAFALFIVCPRMAAMLHVITRSTETNLVYVSVLGTIIALPFVIAMVLIFKQYGLLAALGFLVLTDVLAALLMGKVISLKAGLETFIIALFVIAGARVAPIISSHLGLK